jgi:hypothetical protein
MCIEWLFLYVRDDPRYSPPQQKAWYTKNTEEYPEIKAMLESEQRFEIIGTLRRMPQNFLFKGLPDDIKDDYKALESFAEEFVSKKLEEYNTYLERQDEVFSTEQLEEAMQKVMDTYAGGIGSHYQFNEKQLELAKHKIEQIITLSGNVSAADYHGLMFVYELKERLTVCQMLIEHLKARKETRWHSFAENLDYPDKSDEWLKYVNTRKNGDNIEVIFRNLVGRGETYEHSDR